MPVDPDPETPGFNPLVPGLIGLAVALAWCAAFPAMAQLCAFASEMIARINP